MARLGLAGRPIFPLAASPAFTIAASPLIPFYTQIDLRHCEVSSTLATLIPQSGLAPCSHACGGAKRSALQSHPGSTARVYLYPRNFLSPLFLTSTTAQHSHSYLI